MIFEIVVSITGRDWYMISTPPPGSSFFFKFSTSLKMERTTLWRFEASSTAYGLSKKAVRCEKCRQWDKTFSTVWLPRDGFF